MDKKEKKAGQEEDFEMDQVVWAKVKGFSWWPGVVREVIRDKKDLTSKKKDYVVFFLGEFSQY
jgi:hypothetical protein